MKYDKQYNDIINLPYYVSKKYPQMSLYARSTQFVPFAALTGYNDVIKETGRLTNERKEIDKELRIILDYKVQIIREQISRNPEIIFTYFIAD